MDKGLLFRVTEQWKFLLQKNQPQSRRGCAAPRVTLVALSEKF